MFIHQKSRFRSLFFIFFLLWSFRIYAQIRSGEIEYAIEIEELPEIKSGENKDDIRKRYKMSKDYVAQMSAVLKFDRSKALFKLEEGMEMDRKPYYRFSKTLVGLDKVYLIGADANKLVIQQEDFMTMHFFRDKTKDAGEWKIS